MGEVKRYTLSAFMDEREDGLYVDREDYDAVERERDALRADLQATREALHEWDNRVGRLQDEVAALKAACAHRLEALRGANHRIIYGEWASDYSHSLFAAALSTDAGKGWIDATGAVEARVTQYRELFGDGSGMCAIAGIPADWAGSRVLIVRVAPKP